MIPITRKDHYLNEIVGWGDTAPEKPYIEEEFFFAEILGEAVQAPEPLPRYQMYLAKIAGRNIEIPYPEVRLEYFLARAAGMEIETPIPITREEIFWSNYSAIVDFEVEGVPPLSFRAKKAGALENYRIYGNTVGGESAGDLVESGEHAGEYKIPVTVSNGTDTLTTPIYLPEQIRKVGDEAEYIDYKEQKQHRVRKNLLQNTATSQTINGITFTVNDDGSVTCSGILASGIYADLVVSGVFLGDTDILENGNYVVSCANGSNNASLLVGNSEEEVGRVRVAEINISANLTWAMLRIRQADPAITLYPMIRKADIEDDTYEPYIENTDLDVTLPALPTLSGTNTLSVGTTVQPSKVYIKGQKERD